MTKSELETMKALKKALKFWRAKALQLEKYIENHCIDDSFENLWKVKNMTLDRLKRFLELKKKIFQNNKFVELKNTAEEKEYNELAKEYVLMINDKIFNNV